MEKKSNHTNLLEKKIMPWKKRVNIYIYIYITSSLIQKQKQKKGK